MNLKNFNLNWLLTFISQTAAGHMLRNEDFTGSHARTHTLLFLARLSCVNVSCVCVCVCVCVCECEIV